jgi:hypothetical protein
LGLYRLGAIELQLSACCIHACRPDAQPSVHAGPVQIEQQVQFGEGPAAEGQRIDLGKRRRSDGPDSERRGAWIALAEVYGCLEAEDLTDAVLEGHVARQALPLVPALVLLLTPSITIASCPLEGVTCPASWKSLDAVGPFWHAE